MSNTFSILSALRLKGSMILSNNMVDFPANPRPGMLVLKNDALYAYIKINGILTWYPMVRVPKNHTHSQTSPSDNWVVTHNLSSSDLWYQIQDANGQVMLASSIEVVDSNTTRFVFTEPVQGKVLILASANQGAQGESGYSAPVGGNEDDLLVKLSGADFDVGWAPSPASAPVDRLAASDVLLMRFQGSEGSQSFIEDIGGYTIAAQGAQQPYITQIAAPNGGSALRMTGDGYLTITPQNNQLNFGTGNWTIDALLRSDDQTSPYPSWLASMTNWVDGHISLRYDVSGAMPSGNDNAKRYNINWHGVGDAIITTQERYDFDVFRHIRIVKCENILQQYVDKKLVAQANLPSSQKANWAAGGSLILGGGYKGYLSYLRITAAARSRDSFLYNTAPTPA